VQGYIEQAARDDKRKVFSFLRGIIARRKDTQNIIATFEEKEYPGNREIPEPLDDHYTFAGEIPWSNRFASELRDDSGSAKRDERSAFEHHDGRRWVSGPPVEVPAFNTCWESYHSELNQVGAVTVLAPAISEELRLSNRRGEWDLYDQNGRLASIGRAFKQNNDSFDSHLLYLRADLMAKYLADKRDLVWLVWGERGIQYDRAFDQKADLHDLYRKHLHIHKSSCKWQGQTASDRFSRVKRKSAKRPKRSKNSR
jgi:hypothetical protein